jgi:hypothetical protein
VLNGNAGGLKEEGVHRAADKCICKAADSDGKGRLVDVSRGTLAVRQTLQ